MCLEKTPATVAKMGSHLEQMLAGGQIQSPHRGTPEPSATPRDARTKRTARPATADQLGREHARRDAGASLEPVNYPDSVPKVNSCATIFPPRRQPRVFDQTPRF
jgi:hypothetical protein